MVKENKVAEKDKLREELQAEIRERLKDRVAELIEIDARIERAVLEIEKHQKMKRDAGAQIESLHQKTIEGEAGEENIDNITYLVAKSQTIDRIAGDFRVKIEKLKQEREGKLREIGHDSRIAFYKIVARYQKEIFAEGDAYAERVEAFQSILEGVRDISSYIPGLENYRNVKYRVPPRTLYLPSSFMSLEIETCFDKLAKADAEAKAKADAKG